MLLQKFLDSGLDTLAGDNLDALERLLAEPDQDILAWLWNTSEPQDPEVRAIVKIMRNRIELQANADE